METHLERISAELKVKQAKAAFELAINGSDESAVIIADKNYKSAIAVLVSVEMEYPTARELSKRRNRIRLENMGLCG